jgi:hypothetical protein
MNERTCRTCGILSPMPASKLKNGYYKCKKCCAKYIKDWKNNDPKAKQRQALTVNRYQRNLRRLILEHYSGHIPAQCVQCGENRYACLELDHINDDGAEHGKRLCKATGHRAYRGVNSYIYRDIKKNNYPPGYQTLCANCHSIKTKGSHYGSDEYFKGI